MMSPIPANGRNLLVLAGRGMSSPNVTLTSSLSRRRFSAAPVVVDLRSDTVTKPTEAMRAAMARAEVGNDVYGEDPTAAKLEEEVSGLLGKESGLFVTSGTMANLLAAMTHCQVRGAEAFLGDKSHMFLYSQGNLAQCKRALPVYVENTHNDCGGLVLPREWTDSVLSFCRRSGMAAHLDGARLLNAAVASDVDPAALCGGFSSVSTCMSKGVGAPVGSVLCGDREFIRGARRFRKAIGGGGTQVGVLAAAALVGLKDFRERMQMDHEHAKEIARGLESLGSKYATAVENDTHTNMVIVKVKCVSPEKFCSRIERVTDAELKSLGFSVSVRAFPLTSDTVRLVTHSDISRDKIRMAAQKLRYVAENILQEN